MPRQRVSENTGRLDSADSIQIFNMDVNASALTGSVFTNSVGVQRLLLKVPKMRTRMFGREMTKNEEKAFFEHIAIVHGVPGRKSEYRAVLLMIGLAVAVSVIIAIYMMNLPR